MRKKDLWICAGALIMGILLSVLQFFPDTVPTGAWGLSFQQNGQAPRGPASVDQLKKYDACYVGDPDQPVLYLTFDAGYENGYTESILDTLKKHNVTAAFFLVGNYVEKNPDLVRRMVADGHIVANHTLNHKDMSQISDPEAFAAQLRGLEDLFQSVTGKEMPKYYRPPQGIYSAENLKAAQSLGYRTVFWSLAYADWDNNNQPSEETAFSKLLPRTHNGAVILLHSTSQTNARVLDRLLTQWKDMGYRFQSIDKLYTADH